MVGDASLPGRIWTELATWQANEEWSFPPGKYQIIRQRERGPEGWKRVED